MATGSGTAGAAAAPAGGAGTGVPAAAAAAGSAAVGAGALAGAAEAPKEAGGLEADPDLEAYLQVAINEEKEGASGEEEVGDEDIDLDSYINELSAEVEAADEGKKE